MPKARILLYDIETSPILAYVWGTYQQDVLRVVQDWYILCFAYKWYGEKRTHVISLPQHKNYKKNPTNDRELVKKLHGLFNEADIVVAHNGDRFDQKKTNARFLLHGLLPPTPYRTVDTLKVARKYFKMNSNRLDSIGRELGLGRKVPHTGFQLWEDCMNGDAKAWRLMEKYNKQDVVLLEQVYESLRPWMDNHPSVLLLEEKIEGCAKCGSDRIFKHGKYYTKVNRVQNWRCRDCGGYSKSRVPDKIEKPQLVN